MFKEIRRRKPLQQLQESGAQSHLHKVLSSRDLTALGIAAIIGAGSFSSLGEACFKAGPGVVILFIITGIACGFTALCYAEFASRIPVAGSAYTYAYVSFGELAAWIIGWALLMEYSIGNIYVAFSWSDYFTSLMERFNIHIPDWLTCSHMEARKAVENASINQELINAWNNAPLIGNLRIIFDLPAVVINILITALIYIGIRESRNMSNIMVALKLSVILLVIIVGAFLIQAENWFPINEMGQANFMPNGFSGVMTAVSGVFFAYIGFDAISVFAEESKNPQKDLPKGMIYSLIICTVVYIVLAFVLTGVLDYKQFDGIGDPLAYIFEVRGLYWMQMIVAFIAVVAMTSVLLVFQMGQPRIWMSMSRDGLLPEVFQKIHPKYKTPSFATIVTGIVVGLPIFFTDKTFVLDFTSIATLFAFVLVCAGILFIPRNTESTGHFKLWHINGKYLFPILVIGTFFLVSLIFPEYFKHLIDLDGTDHTYKISTLIFWCLLMILALLSYLKELSLIPLLGVTSCSYLLTGMTASNWLWFVSWLGIGLIIYFSYSMHKSKLSNGKQ
ncbi:MAG: amino acid permease [Saprospiraceae bacterium]|nr:amino acid permease [Saprospiraceae bacterium]